MSLEDSDPKVPPRPIPEITTSDEGKAVIGVDDLVVRERRRLGDYVAHLTQQVYKNKYPVRDGSELFKTKMPSGNPAPISDTNENAVLTHMDEIASTDKGQVARAIFESSSESGLLDTDTPFKIKKGKSDDSKTTGTEYLNEIEEKGGRAEIPQRVQSVMFANNRFSEDFPAVTAGTKEGERNTIGSLIVQPKLGQHLPQKFPKKADGDGGGFVSIPISKLKNFGLTTLLHGSGELNIPTDLSDPEESLGATISTALPGLARFGKRVPVTRFDGVKILNEMEPTLKKNIRDNTLQGTPILSHGNVNNPLVPFSGLLSVSSTNSAQLLALTVATLLKGLCVTLNGLNSLQGVSSIAGDLTAAKSASRDRRLRLGNYPGRSDESATYRPYKNYTVVDIVETAFPYFDCLNKGISVFFGTENNADLLVVGNESVHLASGWYNTVFRTMIKTTNELIFGLMPLATPDVRTSYDVDPNLTGSGNVGIDAATSVLTFIKALNESKILKFMNIMALIGESAMLAEDSEIPFQDVIKDISDGPNGGEVPKLGVLHMKNRLSDQFGNRMAWASNTVSSMYLLPNEIKTAARRLDGDDGRFTGLSVERGFIAKPTNRFSADEVERMENYLEADYLPFYFHDLRTNEIIAFHAFLETISDNYNVDYTENEGYGRVGKVLTYKNTNREISLEFMVVATGEDDFSDMWLKINKLTTMLYPQYTAGRALQFGGDSFVQPFSQIPAVSPFIRLRVGDVFKSNYNKFDLARLFGLGSAEFHVSSQAEREETATAGRNTVSEVREFTRLRMTSGDWQPGEVADLDPTPSVDSGARPRGRAPRETAYQRLVETTGPSAATPQQRRAQADLTLASKKPVRIVGQMAFPRGGGTGFAVQLTTPATPEEQGTFIVPVGSLKPNDAEVERQTTQASLVALSVNGAGDIQQDRQALEDFFAATGENANPIFKSFESVRGRGLAGFITSMNMDIDKSFTWETVGLNNRAPKMVKISIEFSPVHDLQPGLDHNGFSSAPIYNIGSALKKTTMKSNSDLETKEIDYGKNTRIKR